MNGKQMAPDPSAGSNGDLRFTIRFGPAAVVLALVVALISFLIFAGFTPIAPSPSVLLGLLLANILGILLVFWFVFSEAYALFKARRAGVAAAQLHIRIVGLFSIIAAAPALLMAGVGSVTLDRSLKSVLHAGWPRLRLEHDRRRAPVS